MTQARVVITCPICMGRKTARECPECSGSGVIGTVNTFPDVIKFVRRWLAMAAPLTVDAEAMKAKWGVTTRADNVP